MDLISGSPLWPTRSGLLHVYPPLRESLVCDVAVLGGGITGALAAHALCEAGFSTVVLDRRDIATGSTCGSTGLLQYELDLPMHRLARVHGEEHAVRSYRCCRDAIASIARLAASLGEPCGFARRGSLQGASSLRDVPGLLREFEMRRRHGFRVKFWERRKIRSQTSLPWSAALLSDEAAEVDSYRLAHALFHAAKGRRLKVYDRTEVRAWRCRRNDVLLKTAEGFQIKARRLVIATGYETQPFARRPFTKLHSTYVLAGEPTHAFPGWPDRRLLWETARPYLYLRTTDDRRPMIGGGDVPFNDLAARDALLPAKTRWLERKFRQLFPRIDFEPGFSWTGTFAVTPDGLPYIGSLPQFPNVLFALGYGGNGIVFSQVAAEIIRDTCLGERHPNADLFRFERAKGVSPWRNS